MSFVRLTAGVEWWSSGVHTGTRYSTSLYLKDGVYYLTSVESVYLKMTKKIDECSLKELFTNLVNPKPDILLVQMFPYTVLNLYKQSVDSPWEPEPGRPKNQGADISSFDLTSWKF